MCLRVLVQPRDRLYKPNNNVVTCVDPVCSAMHSPGSPGCKTPNEQCDYEVTYADDGSSIGVLVKDYFPIQFTNGSNISPRLAFGWVSLSLHQCGLHFKFWLSDSFELDVHPKSFVFLFHWNASLIAFGMTWAWSQILTCLYSPVLSFEIRDKPW